MIFTLQGSQAGIPSQRSDRMENKRAKKAYAFTLSVILMSIVIVSLASFASQTLRQSRTDYISLESSE